MKKELFVSLVAHTPLPQSVAAMGAKLCYSGSDVEALKARVESADQSAFLKKLADMGHLSPIEHASFTFGVQGVSRALLAQITRHRIASFSVQSQRYVAQTGDGGFGYILPPSVAALGEQAVKEYAGQMAQMAAWYDGWVARLGADLKEDARMVLPNACETRFLMTMNGRELGHMLSVRCCNRAQWEIRAMAWAVLGLLMAAAPSLFEHAGPDCLRGACSQGGMGCGKADQIDLLRRRLEKLVALHGQDEDFDGRVSRWAAQNIV